MNSLSDTWFMVGRQARNLMREPIWIALLLIQPLVWLLLYGQLFKNVTQLGGFGTQSYITFLAPAIVVMNAFFGATWSGMAMIQDLDRDVIERFLTTPVRRSSIVVSQIVRSAITAAIQATIIIAVSYVLGVRSSQGLLGVLVVILAGVLVNSAFAGMSQGIALLTRKEATMIAVANFIGLPLLFLSSTLLAATQMPQWMQTVAKFNPVNWGVVMAREAILPGTDWTVVVTRGLALTVLTFVMAAFATWTFRAYRRTL